MRGVFSNIYLSVLLPAGEMCGTVFLIVLHVCETGSPTQRKSYELMMLENRGTWLALRGRGVTGEWRKLRTVVTSLLIPTVSHIFQDNKTKAYEMGGFYAK